MFPVTTIFLGFTFSLIKFSYDDWVGAKSVIWQSTPVNFRISFSGQGEYQSACAQARFGHDLLLLSDNYAANEAAKVVARITMHQNHISIHASNTCSNPLSTQRSHPIALPWFHQIEIKIWCKLKSLKLDLNICQCDLSHILCFKVFLIISLNFNTKGAILIASGRIPNSRNLLSPCIVSL